MILGYARVSTDGQNLDAKVKQLSAAGAANAEVAKAVSVSSWTGERAKLPAGCVIILLFFFFCWILLRSVTLAACGTGILDSRFRFYNAVACQNKFPFITIIE